MNADNFNFVNVVAVAGNGVAWKNEQIVVFSRATCWRGRRILLLDSTGSSAGNWYAVGTLIRIDHAGASHVRNRVAVRAAYEVIQTVRNEGTRILYCAVGLYGLEVEPPVVLF